MDSLKLKLSTQETTNEFFDLLDNVTSKSSIQVNRSFEIHLDDDVDVPFTPPQIEKEQCPNCQRTFFKGKLELHRKSCTSKRPLKLKAQSQAREQKCQWCSRKLTPMTAANHLQRCPKRPQVQITLKSKYVITAAINEEEENDETMIQPYGSQQLSNSQPSFLPKIQNPLSRSVPIMRCPHCSKTFEQRAALKHIPHCQRGRSEESVRIFCTNCGVRFANQHKYCGSCGRKR